jgi:hypothetical protein
VQKKKISLVFSMNEVNRQGAYNNPQTSMLNPNCQKPELDKDTYFMITKGTR